MGSIMKTYMGVKRFILSRRKAVGGVLLFVAWACNTFVKPELDEKGRMDMVQFEQFQDAYSSATLSLVHLRLVEYSKTALEELVPDSSKAPETRSLLAGDRESLLDELKLKLGVAVHLFAKAGGIEAPPKRYEGKTANNIWEQAKADAEEKTATMNRKFNEYRLFRRVADAIGQLAFILGTLLII